VSLSDSTCLLLWTRRDSSPTSIVTNTLFASPAPNAFFSNAFLLLLLLFESVRNGEWFSGRSVKYAERTKIIIKKLYSSKTDSRSYGSLEALTLTFFNSIYSFSTFENIYIYIHNFRTFSFFIYYAIRFIFASNGIYIYIEKVISFLIVHSHSATVSTYSFPSQKPTNAISMKLLNIIL